MIIYLFLIFLIFGELPAIIGEFTNQDQESESSLTYLLGLLHELRYSGHNTLRGKELVALFRINGLT